MDRRKLTNRNNPLHRQLYSSSQLSISRQGGSSQQSRPSSTQVSKDLPPRSVSALEQLGRKRKNSMTDEEKETTTENDENDEGVATRIPGPTKRQRCNRIDDEDEEVDVVGNNESESSKDPTEETPQSSSSGASYIRGVLEKLDKSPPSKLSQNSNTSVDKYRKINLRTPVRSRMQKPVSKTIANKKREQKKEDVVQADKTEKVQSPAKSSKTNRSQSSTVSIEPEKKKSPAKSATQNKRIEPEIDPCMSDDEEMSFSDTDVPPKKLAKKNESPVKPSTSKSRGSPYKMKIKPLGKNKRNRDISPELSPLRDFGSPERNNINTRKKKTASKGSDDKFTDFVSMVGITLYSGDNNHVISEDPREIIQKMKELLNSDRYIEVDDLINSWNNYIDDEENLKKSFVEMKIENDEGVIISSKAVSLCRLLIQVPQIQIQILNSLFKKLIDAVITTESSDDAPWAVQMLQQFRFLEMLIDPDFLIKQIDELLSSSPEWFQREVIIFIPDIVTDTQHRTTAEMLVKIMEINSDLTNIILDCIHNLILGKDYREELREHVLGLLDKNFDKSTVPAITRFVLTACSSETIALKSLHALRLIDMVPTSKEKREECDTHQVFMVNAIKASIHLFKEVTQATVSIIKTPTSEAKPLDLILSILLHETTAAKKKIVEAALHTHIKDGYYKSNFLNNIYSGYKEVMKGFQSTTLSLAMNLLKADSTTHTEFGIEWLRNIFISQSETSYKQREIMEKLLNLMGSKGKTVKNALEVLCRMAEDENERQFLEQHAGFLRSFLEKVDNLQFDEVAKLYHLLHGLCTQSEKIANILNDDLTIIMQKQLCSSKVVTKCKGVVGAVMAIRHQAGNRETSGEAFKLLRKTLLNLKTCMRSQALFYDQLAQVIASAENIDHDFLDNVSNYFEDDFVNNCLVDTNTSGNLVPKFGLNDASMAESEYYVHFGSGKVGAAVPVFFKLLRICCLRLSGNLESINAVLGCPVLMPDDMDMPEPSTADFMIHCINWFREIIGGFVTQEETLLREQVLKRLESLMSLQGELVSMIAMCNSHYQPPPAYFHYFPTPQFVRIEMKLGKRGVKRGKKAKTKDKSKDQDTEDMTELTLNKSVLNKSVILPEWESWEHGSEMTIKNPAFFRQMDTKIINLLDANMDIHSTQSSAQRITIAQVCFIVKELLGMFENQATESFMRDLIQLLPKICAKLQKIIADLRQNDSAHEKEAVRLLLCLLITLFSWKEFKNARYNTLLRDALRNLAGMMNESSALLRSCRDLVAEAYKYFESLADIATQISLAVALVNMCSCLMKHSNTFTEQSKDRQAKMAYGFLCLEWTGESHGPQYKLAVRELLKTWMENETNPLRTVSSVLDWLPEQAEALDRPQSRLSRLPSVTKINFGLLLKQLFSGLIKGVDIALEQADKDPERIMIWLEAATSLESLAKICKTSKNNAYLVFFLRYSTMLYHTLLTSGMRILEANIKYQTDEVLNVIKSFQKTGRFLRDIFCAARKDKIVVLLKLIPLAKSRREKFIYRVKGMLTANHSIGAFWMGNLLNKDLDGEEIASESTDCIAAGSDVTDNNDAEEEHSEVFNSNSEEEEEESDETAE